MMTELLSCKPLTLAEVATITDQFGPELGAVVDSLPIRPGVTAAEVLAWTNGAIADRDDLVRAIVRYGTRLSDAVIDALSREGAALFAQHVVAATQAAAPPGHVSATVLETLTPYSAVASAMCSQAIGGKTAMIDAAVNTAGQLPDTQATPVTVH